ncbi:MAG: flavin reductase [Verrucomicrobiota bacterium]
MTPKHFSRSEIESMEQRYRVKFINSLPGYKSLNLVGTISPDGEDNVSIVSTVTHFGSAPPLLGYVSRPATVDRHTLSNIEANGCYTLNQVSTAHFAAAHQTSARYPRETSEFDATGLERVFRDGIEAPFVASSPVQIHLEFRQKIDIELNGTVLILGEVKDVFVDPKLIETDGNIDLALAATAAGSGLDGYYAPELISRVSYAKPDQPVTDLATGEELWKSC